jgi:hypothetical protein
MTDQPSTGAKPGEQVVNALKLVADVAVLPGSGQLVEGKVREGVLYGLAGLTVKVISPVLLGPLWWVPWVGVGLDSFSRSAAGKHLWQLNQQPGSPIPVSKETSGIEP